MAFWDRLFGAKSEVEEATKTNETENEHDEDEPSVQGMTTDDIIKSALDTLMKETEKNPLDDLLITRTDGVAPSMPKTESKYEVADRSSADEALDENATVEDLVKYIEKRVAKIIDERLSKAQSAAPTPRWIVEDVVAEIPELESVKAEALRLLSTNPIPSEMLSKDSIRMMMYALKGMKAEYEKKQAVAEILRTAVPSTERPHTGSAAPVQLPYSTAELQKFADDLGISVDILKKRLAERLANQR